MAQIDHIKTDIEALSSEDFAQLRAWMAEKDSQNWDEKIEKDASLGKLDFLRKEALAAKEKGQLGEL